MRYVIRMEHERIDPVRITVHRAYELGWRSFRVLSGMEIVHLDAVCRYVLSSSRVPVLANGPVLESSLLHHGDDSICRYCAMPPQ